MSLERTKKNLGPTIPNTPIYLFSFLFFLKPKQQKEKNKSESGTWLQRINTCLYSSRLGFQRQCQHTAKPDFHLCILPQPCCQHSVSQARGDSHKRCDCQKANSSLYYQISLCTSFQHLKDISTGQDKSSQVISYKKSDTLHHSDPSSELIWKPFRTKFGRWNIIVVMCCFHNSFQVTLGVWHRRGPALSLINVTLPKLSESHKHWVTASSTGHTNGLDCN